MRGATLYLNEMLEEREREQRRRARKAFGGAIVVAALGIAAAMREAPPREAPPPKIVDRPVPFEVECTLTRRETIEQRVIVPAPPPPAIEPLTLGRHYSVLVADETVDPRARHLCLTPKNLDFSHGMGTSDRVVVSNPSGAPITIAKVSVDSDRAISGFVVTSKECDGRTLLPKERCTIYVTLCERIGETIKLLIAHDAEKDPEAMTIEARETPTAAASPAKPAPAS